MRDNFKLNNFDLIRLIAAMQVAIHHLHTHLNIEHSGFLLGLLTLIPGVPVFFFTSGFLISRSYENNLSITDYARNRTLRIYPALIICTVASMTSVYLTGYFSSNDISIFKIIPWFLGQISFVQFYNPEFMRNFGTGVLNGSLWTITVELQFYILIPLVYNLFNINRKNRAQKNLILLVLIFLFMTVNIIYNIKRSQWDQYFFFKLLHVSFFPWFYMFLFGVLFQMNFEVIYRYLNGRFYTISVIFLSIICFCKYYFGWQTGNGINPLLFVFLVIFVFSFAYSFQGLSDFLLRKNDVSYGLYIYHIPVVNLFMFYNFDKNIYYLIFAIVTTAAIASLSWFFIEKSMLKLKNGSLNSYVLGHVSTDKLVSRR